MAQPVSASTNWTPESPLEPLLYCSVHVVPPFVVARMISTPPGAPPTTQACVELTTDMADNPVLESPGKVNCWTQVRPPLLVLKIRGPDPDLLVSQPVCSSKNFKVMQSIGSSGSSVHVTPPSVVFTSGPPEWSTHPEVALIKENSLNGGTPTGPDSSVLRTVHVAPPSDVEYSCSHPYSHPFEVSKNWIWY